MTRILVVEDDAKLGPVLCRGLSCVGFAAELARSGERALELAARHPFDALVIDLMLPGMDGLEACRRLRQRGLRAPVVIISARNDLTEGDLRAVGADDYLVKPFGLRELEGRLRALPAISLSRSVGAEPPPPGAGSGSDRSPLAAPPSALLRPLRRWLAP